MLKYTHTHSAEGHDILVSVEQDGQTVAGCIVPAEFVQTLMDFYNMGVRYGHMGLGVDTKFETVEA